MQNYSYNEFTKELLISTLRPIDWLDYSHPAIPKHSVIADVELPEITDKQAFIVVGERSKISFMKGDLEITINECFLVSKNLEIIEDHRGKDVYSTIDGSKVEIKELGVLPDNVTTIPRPDQFHIFQDGEWVLDQSAKDQAEKQAKIDALNAEMTKLRNDIIFGQAMGDDVSKEIARVKEIREELAILQ